ncbi:MAG TPA: hypothetical protein VFJ29_07605, partial [Candidatus Kapabacteria bacterium]|nr:hypothetical protein [Candidatus Kapabacteria bacterium]
MNVSRTYRPMHVSAVLFCGVTVFMMVSHAFAQTSDSVRVALPAVGRLPAFMPDTNSRMAFYGMNRSVNTLIWNVNT